MHGLTLRVRRTVLPRGLKNPPSLTPVAYGEEGRFDTASRAVTHTVGHNSVATFDGPRESVFESRGNAQPQYPLRGILALRAGRMSIRHGFDTDTRFRLKSSFGLTSSSGFTTNSAVSDS